MAKSTGKRLRFEIFKRDGFTCQYCGQRPPDVVLELDHIHPRAAGGTDDELNLITACADCNRGKSDKKLGDVHPRPDADLKYFEVQQEIAEAKRYLAAAEARDSMHLAVVRRLQRDWVSLISDEYEPTQKQWGVWLAKFSPDEIYNSMKVAAPRKQAGHFGRDESDSVDSVIRYMSGVMIRTRQVSEDILQ